MSEQDITILPKVPCMGYNGRIAVGRLYYYQGNFFWPISVSGSFQGKLKKAIRSFIREYRDIIARDRAHPDYKTITELVDLEPYD